ncbi:hypothetical protein HPB52_003011 [Rhipicephalus sanguineus]|uniref:Uncharacterized protein n=1 Tax=Rhipicephalus sanguineus TaxID=34632 RepID=A0A9D4PQV9_RHISA|nr:hypothetical protein HPB52_003011 [Rhipicephalus sanguineus]
MQHPNHPGSRPQSLVEAPHESWGPHSKDGVKDVLGHRRYMHCGSCPLTCESFPGLIVAAEHYNLPELMQACFHHAKQHLRLSVVCGMLNVLENY